MSLMKLSMRLLCGQCVCVCVCVFFFFQADDGIRDAQESRGLGDVYKRQDFADRILLPARPVFEPFDGGLEILYLLSETLTARLRVELDGITSRWRLSLRNAGAETLSVLPVFPLIGGLTPVSYTHLTPPTTHPV